MKQSSSFNDVLEAAGKLSIDEQETLLEVLNRRFVDLRRARIAREMTKAEEEFKAGKCRVASPEDLVAEIFS